MDNALLLDNHLVQGSSIGDHRYTTPDALLFYQVFYPLLATTLFVRGHRHTHGQAGTFTPEVSHQLNHDRQLSLHITRSGAVNPTIPELGSVTLRLRMMHHIQMTTE